MRALLDLQLFAEDGGAEAIPAAEASAPQITDAGGNSQESQVQNTGETAQESPRMGIVVDPNTGRRTVQEIVDAPQAQGTVPAAAEREGAGGESLEEVKSGMIVSALNPQPEQAKRPYSEQELLLAINMGNAIDESRIPPQYAMQYGEYKAKRELMAQQGQAGQRGQSEENADLQPGMRDFYDRIRALAHQTALAQTGMSAEEYEAARFSDDAGQAERARAYDIACKYNEEKIIETIRQRERVQNQMEQERQVILRDIDHVVDGLRQSEPHFNEIDALMGTRYQMLPYKEAHEVAQVIAALGNRTITPEQCKVLQKYYDDTRMEFYAKMNKLSTSPAAKPPVVERPGTGMRVPQNFDFSEMRKMDVRQRREYMANYFNKK